MNKPPVAITIRSFHQNGHAWDILNDNFEVVYINSAGLRLSENELISVIGDAGYVIAGTEQFSRKVLDAVPNLKVISRVGVGIDNIDPEAAKEHRIIICSTPDSPVTSVAEHTLALILSLVKHIPAYNFNMRNNNFKILPGTLIQAKTVGVVGMGRIGYVVASYLSGLGCTIQYFDPYVKQKKLPETWKQAMDLEELVSHSDILTLHAPPQPNGTPLITKKIIAACKPGIIIINTARGSLLDESALMHGLDSGLVSGAGLDVFSTEPYDGPLLKYSQVIVTPHVSSNTREARDRMETEAVQNLIAAIQEVDV